MSSKKKGEYKSVNRIGSRSSISGTSMTIPNNAINGNNNHNKTPDDPNKVEIKTIPNQTDKDSWKRYVPVIYWLPKYSFKSFFAADLIAAITGCIMVIPQGMGYALTAGLDPIYGLYSSLFGPLLYWPFGTSGQLIIAPMAVVSLMTMQTVKENSIRQNDPVEAVLIASAIAFQSGLILLLLGLLKGGVLASMLSKSVLIGFTSAAAILIGLSQMQFIFNIYVEGGSFLVMIRSLFKNIKHTHVNSLLLSIGSIAFLLTFRILKKNFVGRKYDTKFKKNCSVLVKYFPSELIMVIIGILITYSNKDAGFDIIGDIPKGLPPFKNFLGSLSNKLFWNSGMWLTSFLIAILTFIESFAGAQKYGDKLDYKVDPSQELIALGVSNCVMSWFQCFISGGALSRTSVVGEAGAVTPLTSLLTGLIMIIAILILLPIFKFIPKPVLGSIVIVGVIGLFDVKGMKHLWKINKSDFVVMLSTVIVTILLGIDIGVGVGVILSILIFLENSANPHYSVLGRITRYDDNYGYTSPDDEHDNRGNKHKKDHYYIYKDIKYNKNAKLRRDMLMIRWDAPIFFGNFNSFKKRINKQIYRFLLKNEKFLNDNIDGKFCLTLSFESVTDIDTTGVDLFYNFITELKKKYNIYIIISRIKKHIYEVFSKHEDILIEIGVNNITYASLYECEKIWNKYLVTQFPNHFKKNLKMVIRPSVARYNTPSINDEQHDIAASINKLKHNNSNNIEPSTNDSQLYNRVYKSEYNFDSKSDLVGNNAISPHSGNYISHQHGMSNSSIKSSEIPDKAVLTNDSLAQLSNNNNAKDNNNDSTDEGDNNDTTKLTTKNI